MRAMCDIFTTASCGAIFDGETRKVGFSAASIKPLRGVEWKQSYTTRQDRSARNVQSRIFLGVGITCAASTFPSDAPGGRARAPLFNITPPLLRSKRRT